MGLQLKNHNDILETLFTVAISFQNISGEEYDFSPNKLVWQSLLPQSNYLEFFDDFSTAISGLCELIPFQFSSKSEQSPIFIDWVLLILTFRQSENFKLQVIGWGTKTLANSPLQKELK